MSAGVVAETLQEIAADPKHLGAHVGFLAVLHTWGQNLMHHPHVHCVVPGGGIAPDGRRWVPCKEDFFLPVQVLSPVFRGKFIDLLKRAFRQGKLGFYGKLESYADLSSARQAAAWHGRLSASRWPEPDPALRDTVDSGVLPDCTRVNFWAEISLPCEMDQVASDAHGDYRDATYWERKLYGATTRSRHCVCSLPRTHAIP